jgi:hypothetical protein
MQRKILLMAHPNGGSNPFPVRHSFAEAYGFVGSNGRTFRSNGNKEEIKAHQSIAQDGVTPVIVFVGERYRHGSACKKCWGFRFSCGTKSHVGSRIGQCAEPLDRIIP